MSDSTPSQEAAAPDTALSGDTPQPENPPETQQEQAAPPQQQGEQPSAEQAQQPDTVPESDGTVKEWRPDSLKDHERLKDFETADAALEAFSNAKLAGEVPENYSAFGEGISEDFVRGFKEQGYTDEQVSFGVKAISQKQEADNLAKSQAQEKVFQQGLDTLYKTWGEDRDVKLQNAVSLRNVTPAVKAMYELVDKWNQGNNPIIVAGLSDLGGFTKEGGFIKSEKPKVQDNRPMHQRLYPNDIPK